MAATDLVTLADVREQLQISTSDTEQDEVLERLITRLSIAIARSCGREFAPPVDTATRRVRVHPDRHHGGLYVVSLAPYDLRAATLVALHPETPSPMTLTEGIDYMLEPVPSVDGVYTDLHLRPASITWTSTAAQFFGFSYLDVTGSWGFEEVPYDVEQACVLAVKTAMHSDLQSFASALQPNSLGDGVNNAVALPPGVRGLLARYVRAPVI